MEFTDRALLEALDLLGQFKGKPLAGIILERTGTFARYLVTATPPFTSLPAGPGSAGGLDGGSLRARDIGRAAVRRDIGRVYMSPRKIYEELRAWNQAKTGRAIAAAYWRNIRQKNAEAAVAILRRSGIAAKNLEHRMWDGGARHLQKRTPRGHINKGVKPVVIMDKGRDEYIRKVEKAVGYTKSGWVTAARQVNGTGIGQIRGWITAKSGPGYGEDNTQNTAFPTVRLTNAVPWIQQSIPDNFIAMAAKAFTFSLAKEVEVALEYHIARFNKAA